MSEQAQAQTQTVTVDGVEYDLASLSEGVQTAVGLYNRFNGELQTAQAAAQTANAEVLKLQFAMQSLAGQISQAVKAEAPVEDVEAK